MKKTLDDMISEMTTKRLSVGLIFDEAVYREFQKLCERKQAEFAKSMGPKAPRITVSKVLQKCMEELIEEDRKKR